jgi:hypothetical protein
VELGKDSSNLNTWFKGRVREGGITRQTKQQTITLYATGFGSLLTERNTVIHHQQTRDSSDPLLIDSTDNDAKVSEIAKSIIDDTETYLNPELPVVPFSVTGIDDIDVKLVNFDKRPGTTISQSLVELSNAASATWGVDYANDDIWMRYAGSSSSGILITNDLTSDLTSNWDADKIGILLNRGRRYVDSTIGYGYAHFHALGALHPSTQFSGTTSPDATLQLDTAYHAIAFTPTQDNVWLIAPYLVRTGTLTENMHVCLITSDDSGNPDPTVILQRRSISKEELNDVPTSPSGQYVIVEFDRVQVTPKSKLFVYFEQFGDASNSIDINYETGSGEYWTSSDGVTWTDPPDKKVGLAQMRIYSAKKIQVDYENVTLSKLYGNSLYPKETMLPLDGYHEDTVRDMLISISNSRSRQRRMYDPIVIRPPTDPIELGKTVRYIDAFDDVKGLDVTADIVSYSMQATAYELNNDGVHEMTINIEEPFVVI